MHPDRWGTTGAPDRTRTCAPGSGGRRSIQLSYGGDAFILASTKGPIKAIEVDSLDSLGDAEGAHFAIKQ
jgi:hypothetical protein